VCKIQISLCFFERCCRPLNQTVCKHLLLHLKPFTPLYLISAQHCTSFSYILSGTKKSPLAISLRYGFRSRWTSNVKTCSMNARYIYNSAINSSACYSRLREVTLNKKITSDLYKIMSYICYAQCNCMLRYFLQIKMYFIRFSSTSN
jgi:hypothetical protein